MTAYDYQTQEWVKGPRGTKLRLEQLRDELSILRGPNGEEYVKILGCRGLLPSVVRDYARRNCEKQIAEAELHELHEMGLPNGRGELAAAL